VRLIDYLFGSKKSTNCEVVADRLWMTTNSKFVGLAKEVAERSNSGTVAILLVAHFPDVLARLDEITSVKTEVPVKAVLASCLSTDIAAGLKLDESTTIDIIVAERHPLPSADELLEEFADAFPCQCRLSYHLSLDDPVMKAFSGAWVQKLLGKLGMTEEESIESKMIIRRIRDAQRKIESKSFRNMDADSAAEWLKKNCPELRYK
jgi:hypothetical protein